MSLEPTKLKHRAIRLNSIYKEDLTESLFLKLVNEKNCVFPLPSQKVFCGLFGISDDYIEKYISLDDKLIKDRESTFLFRASGVSMEPTVFANDVLVVDRSITPADGHIVIFNNDGELYCKRIRRGVMGVSFTSDNVKFKPLHFNDENEVVIFGVVTAVITENP